MAWMDIGPLLEHRGGDSLGPLRPCEGGQVVEGASWQWLGPHVSDVALCPDVDQRDTPLRHLLLEIRQAGHLGTFSHLRRERQREPFQSGRIAGGEVRARVRLGQEHGRGAGGVRGQGRPRVVGAGGRSAAVYSRGSRSDRVSN